MTDPTTFRTRRLLLMVLTAEQLRLYLADRELLGRELALHFGETMPAPAPALRRAIGLKLTAMAETPAALHPWFTYWLVIIAAEGDVAGLAGFKGSPDEAGQVEIGYGIDANHRRRGYATEAVAGLVRWAFKSPACLAVTARTLVTNEASMAVLGNAGFRRDGADGDELLWRLDKGNHDQEEN
jgi:ribosomal-protein-alanine N-acetyltransferase